MKILSICLGFLFFTHCGNRQQKAAKDTWKDTATKTATTVQTAIGPLTLPAPYSTESKTMFSNIVEWPEGMQPSAPEGFVVKLYAHHLKNPRRTYMLPTGDVLVVESKENRIRLLRDVNLDGIADSTKIFLEGLNKPYGMLVINDHFYVANTDGLYRYPYSIQNTEISGEGEKILDLPAGGYNNHWTRNLIASPDNRLIYISVGSGSNVAENGMDNEVRRANILQINANGTGEKVYASGLRNPVGMDWAPGTNTLWTVVNERDKLGDELVPDYLVGLKEGGFYGWPWSYFGQIEDPRLAGENPGMVKKALVPDVALGAHTAALGLAFYDKEVFPEKYREGAFIGLHGSWNRSALSGYKVVFVPFKNGKPQGPPQDFLSGFVNDSTDRKVYGRPVGVEVLKDGSMLICDDAGGKIWRVSYGR